MFRKECWEIIFRLMSILKYIFISLLLYKIDGPFQDIELLKSRPAHMTVFMRYVFSQLLDPNPLVNPKSLTIFFYVYVF